ncbi:hypothetical protein D3C72_1900500 [compost metagenome]
MGWSGDRHFRRVCGDDESLHIDTGRGDQSQDIAVEHDGIDGDFRRYRRASAQLSDLHGRSCPDRYCDWWILVAVCRHGYSTGSSASGSSRTGYF